MVPGPGSVKSLMTPPDAEIPFAPPPPVIKPVPPPPPERRLSSALILRENHSYFLSGSLGVIANNSVCGACCLNDGEGMNIYT